MDHESYNYMESRNPKQRYYHQVMKYHITSYYGFMKVLFLSQLRINWIVQFECWMDNVLKHFAMWMDFQRNTN